MSTNLAKFLRLLQTDKYTVKALRAETGASVVTVKNRLKELKKEGFKIATEKVREGVRGPASTAYFIAGY